jgi:hypothetical protein
MKHRLLTPALVVVGFLFALAALGAGGGLWPHAPGPAVSVAPGGAAEIPPLPTVPAPVRANGPPRPATGSGAAAGVPAREPVREDTEPAPDPARSYEAARAAELAHPLRPARTR